MAYREAILASSPAGYYRLDEASGTTFADASGNSNTMTLSAVTMISYSQTGLLTGDTNKAIKSNGSNPFTGTVVAPSTTLTGGWSFESWFNCAALPDGTGQNGDFFYITAGSFSWYVKLYSSGSGQPLQLSISQNSVVAYVAGLLLPATRYYLTAVYDTSYFDVYIDNVRVSHVARSANYSGAISTFNLLGHATRAYNVVFDEVAFYNRALTPTEIATHYGYGNGALIDPRGGSCSVLRPRFNPTAQSIFTRGL